MQIFPLASESLGVRSLAIGLKVNNIKILIDPGVAYAPWRFGFRPHPIELDRIKECSKIVEKFGYSSDIIIITHYHRDHFDFGNRISLEIYKDKIVFLKHPHENINPRQRFKRAYVILKKFEQEEYKPQRIEFADGKTFAINDVKIEFSRPLLHGNNPKMGYVLSVVIDDGTEKFLFTSDVQGPLLKEQTEFIIAHKLDYIVIDGPPIYLLGRKFKEENLQIAEQNLVEIVRKIKPKLILFDHHPLRDVDYKIKLSTFFEEANNFNIKVQSYAEFLNKPIELLEAKRKELYERYPI